MIRFRIPLVFLSFLVLVTSAFAQRPKDHWAKYDNSKVHYYDVGNHKSNQDGPAIERLLVEELTASVFEFADSGLAQATAFAVGEIETPLTRFRIV